MGEMKEGCIECNRAERYPDWAVYRSDCRGCAKRQRNSMKKPHPMSDTKAWIGKPNKSKKDHSSFTLEKKILNDLLVEWGNKTSQPWQKVRSVTSDIDRLNAVMNKLSDVDYGACTALIAKYKKTHPEKYSIKTKEHQENLARGHSLLLEEMREVIQKYIWKDLEKK